ncbi:MAG: CHRD domain-containing protein [Thermoleophilia bacterium]
MTDGQTSSGTPAASGRRAPIRTGMLLLLAAGAVGVTGMVATGSGGTSTVTLSARKLTPANEPARVTGAPGATGSFTAKIEGAKMTWTLGFGHLSGPVVAAQLSRGAAKTAGRVLVVLCGSGRAVTCTSGRAMHRTLTAALRTKLSTTPLYVNLTTAKNPKGEIRGQVTVKGAGGAGDAVAGKSTFVLTCQGCHLQAGTQTGSGPQLSGQGLSRAEIEFRIKNGGGGMPAGLVQGTDFANVVAYVLSIQ